VSLCSINIHDLEAVARSGIETGVIYKLCSDLNSQPKWSVTLTFQLLTLKVVSESHVTWVTPEPILVCLGLSVLDLGPMYAT